MGHVPIFAATGLLSYHLYYLCLTCFLPAHGWTGESTGGGGHLYPMIRHSARIKFIGLRCSGLALHILHLLTYCSERRL